MSRLIGQIPDRCVFSADEAFTCEWRTSNHTYGHGSAATSIGAPMRKKVSLLCRHPAGNCAARVH